MTSATFTNELVTTGYGPRRVLLVDLPSKPRFENGGYNNWVAGSLRNVTVTGKIPKNFETTEYSSLSCMGWVSARFSDGSETPIFLHRNSTSTTEFSVAG